ncbi:glycosyltransferase [Actinomadura gamaensis]|uniref:Glycosyltransferase n=1 Tax=Actinomadura gamaensis TaxID=1763541 RepID=A0ABV9U583_9ACTN
MAASAEARPATPAEARPATLAPPPRAVGADATVVEIVIPVLNEERALEGGVRTLHAYLDEWFPWTWRITVVDNGSTDRTSEIGDALAAELPGVQMRRLDVRGKGAAVKAAWRASDAAVVAYMDVDLSTDLGALLPLVAPLVSGHSDLAIGTRLGRGARIRRGLRREAVSRCYNGLLRIGFGARFTDAACGFKAARADVAGRLTARIGDDDWFFDTEMLLLAEFNGLRVHEVAVDWVEDVDSRVRVARTAAHNLRGLARTARAMMRGDAALGLPERPEPAPAHPDAVLGRTSGRWATLLGFVAAGLLATVFHTAGYLLLRGGLPPVPANLGGLLLSTAVNTEANRRWTFPRRGGRRAFVHSRAALLAALNWVLTSVAVTLAATLRPGRIGEACVLLAVSSCLVTLRFSALDRWVFARRG